MSKEYVRQLVSDRFKSFEGLDAQSKAYPNLPEPKHVIGKPWARLSAIDFVLNKVTSIGSEPCTTRTGVIVIQSFYWLEKGNKKLTVLTDELEKHFSFYTNDLGNFWTGAANTVDNQDGKSRAYSMFTTYIPFTYKQGDELASTEPLPPAGKPSYTSPATIDSWLDAFKNNLN